MRTLGGIALALLAVSGAGAQNRSGFVNTGPIVRTPPSVVYPGGTSAMPGVQRTTGSVVYPGGGMQIGVPAAMNQNFAARGGTFGGAQGRRPGYGGHRNGGAVYAYPVYVGGYYGGGYYDPSYAGYAPDAAPQQQQQQPNVTVIMPPQAPPVIINQFGQAPMQAAQPPAEPETAAAQDQSSNQQATHYLIAFKDHTIYSAVAYWVEGDTLHYFTAGNTHNQVSVSLVDRDLTRRLNQETGLEVKLPVGKE